MTNTEEESGFPCFHILSQNVTVLFQMYMSGLFHIQYHLLNILKRKIKDISKFYEKKLKMIKKEDMQMLLHVKVKIVSKADLQDQGLNIGCSLHLILFFFCTYNCDIVKC